jgi:hypothetical protein
MKRILLNALSVGLVLLAAQTALAEPSRLFFQETSAIEPNGSVSLDVFYPSTSLGYSAGLRIGAFDGVVLINSHNDFNVTRTGFRNSSAGFKKMLNKDIAAYGVLSYFNDNADSGTDYAIGITYTGSNGTLSYNLNPELISDQKTVRGNKDTLFLKGGLSVPLTSLKVGKASAVAEVILENNSNLDTVTNLGLRWVPRKDITLDFILYSDRGSPAINGNAKDYDKGVPGMIKANIRF